MMHAMISEGQRTFNILKLPIGSESIDLEMPIQAEYTGKMSMNLLSSSTARVDTGR